MIKFDFKEYTNSLANTILFFMVRAYFLEYYKYYSQELFN